MKTWMKVVLGIVAAIAALVGLVFWLTGDITKAGDDFFAAVQNDDMDSAYSLLSSDFQAGTTKQELQAYLEANGLDDVTDTSWSSRAFENSAGTLKGTVTTLQGNMIPIELKLVKSDTGWRIQSITKEQAGFQTGNTQSSTPATLSQKDAVALAALTTGDFVDGLNAPTMAGFHKTMAPQFQREASVEKLENAFATMRGQKQLEIFKTLKPIVNMPVSVRDDGIAKIEGYYDTRPTRLTFRYSYAYIGSSWKLMGLAVETEPAE